MSVASPSTPEWLARHNATLTASKDGKSWLVHMGSELVYVLALIPVEGKHGIKLMQTINGKQIKVEGIDIVRIKDGKAVEHWGVTDTMTMMQQLGVVPQM